MVVKESDFRSEQKHSSSWRFFWAHERVKEESF